MEVRHATAEQEMRAVGEAAAELVRDGMTVGLGTGATVGYLLQALAERRPHANYVATSPETEQRRRALGLDVVRFRDVEVLDLAIDGSGPVSPGGWLVKGGGGAHTREKVVAASAETFVVIVSSDKLVDSITAPIPLELLEFGLEATLRRLAPTRLREAAPTPDGNRLADYLGDVVDAAALARRFETTPGVVEHGLFPPDLVDVILVGRGAEVERRDLHA